MSIVSYGVSCWASSVAMVTGLWLVQAVASGFGADPVYISKLDNNWQDAYEKRNNTDIHKDKLGLKVALHANLLTFTT